MRRGVWLLVAAGWTAIAGCGGESNGQESTGRDRALERRVGELLPQVEGYSHLAAQRVPAVRLADSQTLETYLLDRLEIEYPGDSLENLARAYRILGLIPDSLDVRRLLVDLILEQAIGYYDPNRDVLFVRKAAPKQVVDAVVVHELVHALQDQQVDLDSLLRAAPTNDTRTARQAVLEGQATLVMFSYQLETNPDQLPEIGPEMADAMASPTDFPQLARAPAIVRDPLLFAYLGGARYVQRLWASQDGKPAPFWDWLPESTEQLLHTERLLDDRDRPTRVEVMEPAGDWEVVYSGDLGELEIRVYFSEHLGDREWAEEVAAGWDGDAYTLLARGADWAFVWYTVWDEAAEADEFEEAYRAAFAARFGGAGQGDPLGGDGREARVERLRISDRSVVRIVETPVGVVLEDPPGAAVWPGGGSEPGAARSGRPGS